MHLARWTVAALLLALLAATPARADLFAWFNDFGRWNGSGWSDGYHARGCECPTQTPHHLHGDGGLPGPVTVPSSIPMPPQARHPLAPPPLGGPLPPPEASFGLRFKTRIPLPPKNYSFQPATLPESRGPWVRPE